MCKAVIARNKEFRHPTRVPELFIALGLDLLTESLAIFEG